MQCWHEGLGTREPVVVVYAFVSSSTRAEPCSLGQLTHVEVVFQAVVNIYHIISAFPKHCSLSNIAYQMVACRIQRLSKLVNLLNLSCETWIDVS